MLYQGDPKLLYKKKNGISMKKINFNNPCFRGKINVFENTELKKKKKTLTSASDGLSFWFNCNSQKLQKLLDY